VLVLGRLVGASRLGVGDLDVAVAWVWTVRAGRIVAMQAFQEERAAREVIASR
jgi:ketosteroid isomerase-like protein